MNRLTNEEKEIISDMTARGCSLRQISKAIKRSKTTIYYHFFKIRNTTCKSIQVNRTSDELVGEFVGLFAGDGSMMVTQNYHYRVGLFFNNKSERGFVFDLINAVLIPLFGTAPSIRTQESRLNLFYYSKNIQTFIKEYLSWDESNRKTYSVHLKSREQSKDFMRGFLRGSIDSDGSVAQKRARFASVSRELIEDISYFLSALDIQHSIYTYHEKRSNRRDMHHIEVSRKDYDYFMRLIKPRNMGAMHRAGIEPASSPWKGEIIPVYHRCME